MEIKQPPLKASASLAVLGGADNQINLLAQKTLPNIPHLLSVPTKTPYRPTFAHENLNTPFDAREVMALQYMTLISSGDRGVGHTAANWQDDMNSSPSQSGGAQSSSGTPSAHREPKKPSVKMSIADYKNMKTTGVKPVAGPPTATPKTKRGSFGAEDRKGHARNTSSTSMDTPMARVSSLESENMRNGRRDGAVKPEHKSSISSERSGQSRPQQSEKDAKNRLPANGHASKELSRRGSTSKPGDRHTKDAQRNSLPPRPPSPRRGVESKQQKRPHDAADTSPEKRQKGERGEVRSTSNGLGLAPRKSESQSLSKLSPSQKPGASHPQTSPPKKASASNPLRTDSKNNSSRSTEKPLRIPKILSPLPDDLIIPPESDDKNQKMASSGKPTPVASPNTIVVKPSRSHSSSRHQPSKLSDELPPFRLPKLLSPDLPDIVEAELLRLKEKGSSNSLNTVEARHEKVRKPGALGVAQKTQRPKVGHPPKKARTESPMIEVEEKESSSRIVRIRYKKRIAKDIQRILALPPKSARKREAERLLGERSRSEVAPEASSDSEDVPIAVKRAAKAPAGTAGQKRPSGLSDAKEGPAKRPKVLDATSCPKASTPLTPAFKSPASTTKDKGQIVTPRKGDAMKSVAMRKVDSSEGPAHTPQSGNFSTSVSTEKPRVNGLAPQVVSQELARASQEHGKFFPLGTTLKRKMDAVFKNTDATEDVRKVAIMNGIEALLCYMLAFHAGDKTAKFRNQVPQPENWLQFFPLWTFMEKKTMQYPELHALVDQLGALSREQLNRASVEQPPDKRDWDKMVYNLKERDRLWVLCRKDEQLIRSLGVTNTLGPWSSVSEAVGFGMATLTCYAEREGGLDWKHDPNLSSSYMRKFMNDDA